jgi:hypothetical protein
MSLIPFAVNDFKALRRMGHGTHGAGFVCKPTQKTERVGNTESQRTQRKRRNPIRIDGMMKS